MTFPQEKTYTIEDIYALPEGQRAELIDGQIYNMAPPNTRHQRLVSEFTITIGNYIRSKDRDCKVFPAPFAVFLNQKPRCKQRGIKLATLQSSGVFDPRGIRQMLVQARHLTHCSRE